MTSVYVENSDYLIRDMFAKRGWELKSSPVYADVICFTGGADVHPMLYGQPKHPKTGPCNLERDERCYHLFHNFVGEKSFIGICRGAQILNVFNGGQLHQHVEGHLGPHKAFYNMGNQEVEVTSTHHQVMIPGGGLARDYQILLITEFSDVEAVYYDGTDSLCFQPHPEYVDYDDSCQELFFTFIKEHLGVE